MKGPDLVNDLDKDLIFTSHDHFFSVQVHISISGVVELHPSGLVNTKRFQEVYKKIVDQLQENYSYREALSLLVVIHLDNLKVENSLREFLRSNFGSKLTGDLSLTIGFICTGFFSRLFWKIWLNGLLNYPCRVLSSVEGISSWQLEMEKTKTGKKEDSLKEAFFTRKEVQYQNQLFKISHKPDWVYHSEEGSFHYILINNEIVLLHMEGILDERMVDESIRIGEEVVKGLEGRKLSTILDIREVKYPSWKVRKYAMKRGEVTEHLWIHRIMIAHPVMAIAYNTLKMAFPVYAAKTAVVTDFEEAIIKYLKIRNSSVYNNSEGEKEKKKKKRKTRKELEQQIREMEENQQLRIQQLFEVFSKISWDDKYSPQKIEIGETDPFFSLFYAVNFFQQDIFEIIQDQKELAQTLEEKVKERTGELNKKNQDLLKANYELMKVNKELDHFVYSVSHDLRAPIASMKGLVNLLHLDQNQESSSLYTSLISKNLDRLDYFIVEILELSRNSRLAINKELINFEEIIASVFEELGHLGNAAVIEKKINILSKAEFISDKQRIIIIFRNLLSNAIKYCLPHYRNPFIHINIKVDAKNACIMVEDNGVGIMNEHQSKVFDMFYRATEQNAGSGLGLYIVKEMVEKLNGTITLKSESNKGTSFILNIPNH